LIQFGQSGSLPVGQRFTMGILAALLLEKRGADALPAILASGFNEFPP
jgi:hypothetical protein